MKQKLLNMRRRLLVVLGPSFANKRLKLPGKSDLIEPSQIAISGSNLVGRGIGLAPRERLGHGGNGLVGLVCQRMVARPPIFFGVTEHGKSER